MTLLALALLAAAPTNQPSVYTLPHDAFIETAKADLDTLHRFVDGMQRVMRQVDSNKPLFATRNAQVYSPDEKQALLSTWGSLFAYFSSTEGLRQKYWGFVKVPPTDVRHAWGFAITHAALTALLANGLTFANLTLNNPQLETIFDEPSDEYGVPKGAFAAFKLKAIHVSTSTQLMTGDSWAPTTTPVLSHTKTNDPRLTWAFESMKRDSKVAKVALLRNGVTLFAGNMKDILKDSTAQAVFPAQKTFAEWAGDTRVARVGKPIITAADIETLVLPKLAPGDVLVARQNWFLSNIGLPGFWPHALLYVGAANDLASAFDLEPTVIAWSKSQPEHADSLSELLRKRFPQKWASYASGLDFQGHGPIRVIESISEGVSFTATPHAFGVDYLAALRPRVAPLDKAKAIVRAFAYQGRPYDFDFDFFSDTSLVCTELVYKAYQPSSDQQGVKLPLVDVAGRRTLPANEIVKRFDEEFDSPARQLDFVLFLDASEKQEKTFAADAAALRASWRRMKWDVAQK
jgi:hypothetical protein